MSSNLATLADKADHGDILADYRKRFFTPFGTTYLGGHSLGLMSDQALKRLNQVVHSWQHHAVESWWQTDDSSDSLGAWLDIEDRAAKMLAPFFGANSQDVTITAGLGINLVWVLHSLYRPIGAKKNIAMMSGMFPQDRWLAMNHLRLPNLDPDSMIWLNPRGDSRQIENSEVVKFIEEHASTTALLILEGVSYLSAQAFDLELIAKAAQAHNVIFIVDVAHSAFILPHKFNQWGIDAAIGCSYKFGCSGPGGIGLIYINEKHWSNPKIWRPGGWWGNERATQFLMGPEFQAAKGAAGWQVSTLPVLAAAPFIGALEIFNQVGIDPINLKARSLTQFFIDNLSKTSVHKRDFDIITPHNPDQRGAEVALEFHDAAKAKSLYHWLRSKGAIVDYRESPFTPHAGSTTRPGIIRAGFNPLYNSFRDAANLIDLIEQGCG